MSHFENLEKRVLAVGAHPDDVLLGAAGYLLQLKDAGYRITILTLTSGSLAGSALEREAEEAEAARLCGFDFLFGRLSDGDISLSAATDLIANSVDAIVPDMVLTHGGEDEHHDHINTHSATALASRFVPNFVTYEGPSTSAFKPSMTVNCTSVWDQEETALRCYRSQMGRRPYLDWSRVTARYRSWPHHVGAVCEAFRVERQDCVSFPRLLDINRGGSFETVYAHTPSLVHG